MGFAEGDYITLKGKLLNNVQDLTVDQEIYVAIEKMSSMHPLKNTDYNDFSLRRQVYQCTKSITYLVYFPYIAINKTNIDLTLVGFQLERKVEAFKSTYLKPWGPKMHIKVDGYQ